MADYLIVTIICGYYILRIFAIRKKIAKSSTRKNFYQHIRHSTVCTSCVMFATLEHTKSFSLIVSALSFLLSRAITSLLN